MLAHLKIESESDIFLQILSEIIELQENGGGGGNQTQILGNSLISNLLQR